MNAHHEALTNTKAVVAAMRDSASVRAAFGGIRNPAVVKAIKRMMQSVQDCRAEWTAQNPSSDAE